MSGEAAEYLAGIPIKAFASNIPSLGSVKRYFQLIEEGLTGSENIFPEHYAFLSRDIPNIEGLANLESLIGEEEIVFVGFPLKIKNGNGAQLPSFIDARQRIEGIYRRRLRASNFWNF